jgi:hypothetical protein
MEQQEPCDQVPQTVLAKEAPQVPSVVATPDAAATTTTTDEGLPKTGSPEVVVDGGLVAVVMIGIEAVTGVAGVVPAQPLWHPLSTAQCPSVAPQYP